MRIAISGSHSLGKSTFVRDFLESHPQYSFEDEPYRALLHAYEIKFAEDQTRHHIQLQLDYCIKQLSKYMPGDRVIFDRCPADYIPYADYTAHYGHTDIDKPFINSLYQAVRHSLVHLDLIVFIPISEKYPIELEQDGHRPPHDFYREWVDKAFKNLYRHHLKSIMPSHNPPKLVEIVGRREERLKQLNQMILAWEKNNEQR